MKVLKISLITIIALMMSCTGFSNSFFKMLFGENDIKVECLYSNAPMWEDGATFEIYKINHYLQNGKDFPKRVILTDQTFHRYHAFSWRPTLASEELVFQRFFDENKNDKRFQSIDFYLLIRLPNTYYVILTDSLNRERLFIYDDKTQLLYYFSLYEV